MSTPTPRRPRSLREVIWLSFSEADERFLDLFRIGYALGILTFLGLAIAAACRGEAWGPVDFGTGLGAILFGGGVGVGLRGRFEDGTPKDQDLPPPGEV